MVVGLPGWKCAYLSLIARVVPAGILEAWDVTMSIASAGGALWLCLEILGLGEVATDSFTLDIAALGRAAVLLTQLSFRVLPPLEVT